MDNKTKFGYDFLYIMRAIQLGGEKSKDVVLDTATKVFLVYWDFTLEEIEDISDRFIDDVEKENLPSVESSMDSLAKYAKDVGQFHIKQLLIQAVAIAYFDNKLDSDETFIVKLLAERLDLRPSEIEKLAITGVQLARGLNIFGKVYAMK